MNLDVDCRDREPQLFPAMVPLLVLVREWGAEGKAAYAQTDLLLFVLQEVHAVTERAVQVRTT